MYFCCTCWRKSQGTKNNNSHWHTRARSCVDPRIRFSCASRFSVVCHGERDQTCIFVALAGTKKNNSHWHTRARSCVETILDRSPKEAYACTLAVHRRHTPCTDVSICNCTHPWYKVLVQGTRMQKRRLFLRQNVWQSGNKLLELSGLSGAKVLLLSAEVL